MKKEEKINETKVKKTRTKKVKEDDVIKKSVEFSLIEVICIVLITGIAVSFASGVLVYNNYDRLNSQIVRTNDENLTEFVDNYNKILNNYVEEVDEKELIEAAIGGMYNYIGDEYTMYIDTDNTSDLKEQLEGEYTGVGLEIVTAINNDTKESVVVITKVFKNSPAERYGLKVNDIVTKVDDVEIKDAQTLSDTIKKGEKESYKITYLRDGKENTITLERERVLINSVSSKEYDNVGYIKIDTFSATTETQVKEILDGFNKNIKSLVIDLRDNTGGYLETAYEVSDIFVEKGKVIYQIEYRDKKRTEYEAKTDVYRHFNKIVVLINKNSASASEILALALRESADAKIVGTTSYGKGTVQETGMLSSGSMVKYTKAYWLSPNGNSINKIGIKPDIEVTDKEEQLNSAIKAAK